jgi:hypothetical protein
LLEDGFAASAGPCLHALVEALKIEPTMQPAIDLMPELLAGMVRGLGASEIELAAVLRRTREALGTSPGAWDGIVRRVMDDA